MNGIVHTAEFFMYFYQMEIKYIEETYGQFMIYKDNEKFTLNFEDIKITITKCTGYSGMKIDFIKLLNNPSISSSDLNEIYKKIYAILTPLFAYPKIPILKRWDFRLDVEFNDKKEKDLIYNLYKKTTTKLNRLKRKIYKPDTDTNTGCNNDFNFYYKTNANKSSITLNIYDKENERLSKDTVSEAYEKNIIRYEVQLRKKHIDYNKYKKNYERELDTYLNEELFLFYMEKYIKPIIFYGNYYDIYTAKKIINANIKRKDEREKLINFLKLVSRSNIDKAKDTYTPHIYKHCIRVLDNLGVNPILIPKHFAIKTINNPLNQVYTIFKTPNK